MKLVKDKSYMWVFMIFAVLFVLIGFVGGALRIVHPKYAVVLFPIVIGFLLWCELRSGIALDSYWKAKFEKGTWQYTALIAWHSFGFVAFLVINYFTVIKEWG